jgi:AraC-like DNA-binding protein
VGSDSHYETARPAAPLRAFIERYVGYRMSGFAPGVHRGLPSRHLTFIVSIGPTIDVIAQTDPHQAPASYHCVVSGLQARSATIGYGASQEGVQIDLSPLGARVLLGMPSRVLWDTSVECSDVVGRPGWELWERLQDVPDWASRFAVCDEVLMQWTSFDAHVAPELSHAWHALLRSGGNAAVGDLATDVGWSRQHLARRFGEEFGLGPKLAARVLRFERATAMLRRMPSFVTIAQVAASCGYYDQSHLDRDFVELAGCTPSQLLAEELPSFQDDPAASG